MAIRKNKQAKSDLDKLVFKGKELSTAEKYLPVIGALGIIVTLVFVFIPTIKNISEVKENISQAEEKYKKIKDQRKTFENLQKNEGEESLDKKMEYAHKYLPSYKPSLEVLINISRLAQLKGVQFNGLTISIGSIKQSSTKEAKSDEKLNDFTLEFGIKGKKDKVLAFITDIKEISPIMKVTDISTKFNEQYDTWDASLTVRVYYKGEPSTVPAIDKPITMISEEESKLLDSLQNYLLASSYFSNLDDIELDVTYGVDDPFQ